MGKRIVILSDGTGNSAAKIWRTNVWRIFESLDLRISDQIAIYERRLSLSNFGISLSLRAAPPHPRWTFLFSDIRCASDRWPSWRSPAAP
jgi:hypothetical protein